MSTEYTKAVRAVKGLSTEELQKLRLHLTALISMGSGSADRVVTTQSHDDWIVMGLAAFMRDAGMPPVSVEQMMAGSTYATFRSKQPPLHNYLARSGDKNFQRALLRVGFKCMHKWFRYKRWNFSYQTFMNHIDKLPGCINREFPGYMESGMIHMIIRGETNVRQKQSKRTIQRKRQPADGE